MWEATRLSQDTYQLDKYKHGGAHIDRYNPNGGLVGRYRLDRTPIPHKGKVPPPVPSSDRASLMRKSRRRTTDLARAAPTDRRMNQTVRLK